MRRFTLGVAVSATVVACASGGGRPTSQDPLGSYDPASRVARASTSGTSGFATIYGDMGLAASGPPISFVGDVSFFASQSPDTTIVIVGLSVPNHGLTFKHTTSGYEAIYVVDASLAASSGSIRQASDTELVRVASFKETSRSDESVIYRRAFRVPPGRYVVAYAFTDVNGLRSAAKQLSVSVPAERTTGISSIQPVYEATLRTRLDSAPQFLPSPRASYVFGVDDSASAYMESYDPTRPASVELRAPNGASMWRSVITLRTHGPGLASGVLRIPLESANVGIVTVLATSVGSADTSRTSFFLGFGPDLPVVSFEAMLGYLRFFASPGELHVLRTASPADRGRLWREFLRRTDPVPSTPQNEALDAYFARIREANAAFRSDAGRGRGWLSDRGMVYVGLGSPDAVYEDYGSMYMTGDITVQPGARVKLLVWEYGQLGARIIFYDRYDTGQWQITRSSFVTFQSLLARNTANIAR